MGATTHQTKDHSFPQLLHTAITITVLGKDPLHSYHGHIRNHLQDDNRIYVSPIPKMGGAERVPYLPYEYRCRLSPRNVAREYSVQ